MFDLTVIKQIPSTDELKLYMNSIMCVPDIFSSSNDIYRTNSETFDINSNKFVSLHEQQFLQEVSKVVNKIKLELESLNNFNFNPEHNIVKLYYWSDANEYYLSNNVFKVYLKILFEHNYIYKLFSNECKINVYDYDYIITTKELIDTLMSEKNFLNNSELLNLFVYEIKMNILK